VADRILARLTQTAEDHFEARIIRVIGAAPDQIVGVYDLVGGQGRVRSTQARRGAEFFVASADSMGAAPGELVMAEVLPARRGGLRQARIRERLGAIGSPKSLSLIAIHNHAIPTVFGAEALAEAEAATLPALGQRTDLRSVPLVTIDPDDARDFDDAVWARPDPDPDNPDGWELIVAIADVSEVIVAGGPLDREARERGNSVYLPDHVVPMLPEVLSAGVCSLKPAEDRACLAVRMWIGSGGTILRHRFERGLIRSAARLSYAQAQDAMDGRRDDALPEAILDEVIKPLYGAFAALEVARKQRQPLEIDLPERRVRFDPDGAIAAIEQRQRLDSHRLIEAFMIAANVCAAKTLSQTRTAAMYRVHGEPERDSLVTLRDFLETLDLRIPKGQVLRPEHFNTVLRLARGTEHEHLVNQVVLRAQAQAIYSPDNAGHFGLALGKYAHFTSPIRRYADLMVHRALIAACKLGPDGEVLGIETLREIGAAISTAERRGMAVEREALDRFITAFMADRVGATFAGRISGVTRFGLFVTLEESGADGLIPARMLGERFCLDSRHHTLVGEASGAVYRLGDSIEVRLGEADPVTGRLRLDLVELPGGLALGRKQRGRTRSAKPAGRRRRRT
jgi:ribonuclease R